MQNLTIDNLKIGDKLVNWYYTGCFGYEPYYVEVVKLGRKKIQVRDEKGEIYWKYPSYFTNKVSEETYQGVIADTIG